MQVELSAMAVTVTKAPYKPGSNAPNCRKNNTGKRHGVESATNKIPRVSCSPEVMDSFATNGP